jgi:hypothetical protein
MIQGQKHENFYDGILKMLLIRKGEVLRLIGRSRCSGVRRKCLTDGFSPIKRPNSSRKSIKKTFWKSQNQYFIQKIQ